MVLSVEEILKRNLIKNRDFGDGEGLVEPEGAAIDVRLGEIWEMVSESEAFLYKETRKTKEYKKVAEFVPGRSDKFILKPNVCYQFKSVEDLDVPSDLVARFVARYNLLANGVLILAYKADPGYQGPIAVIAVNVSGVDFEVELGCRFAQFEFHEIKGKGVMYRGQWKGGRVHSKDVEVQV
jgi:deoxycytidine triphosphate deaminase